MAKEAEVEKGTLQIRVSKEVVSHLSLGLYRNFARAVKELISNAYDAGATEVKIKLDLDASRIIVRDNGRGMDIDEMEGRFLDIGGPTPLDDKTDELGRMRIGTFGIGFLSVFPYCDTLQVVTKKRNDESIIEVKIDTKSFFTKEGTLRYIEQASVPYTKQPSDLPKEKGETIIVLEGIKKHIINELRQKESKGKSSIDKYSGFQKFKWTLSQYAPIQFPSGREDLREFFEDSSTVKMKLWLDAEELLRNVPVNARVLEKDEKYFGNVVVRYAIMTSMKPIEPEEARGIQVRLRNVAVGFPRDFEVVKLRGRVLGKLNYICGEAHILSGLDSALMIDRDNFSYTQDVADISDFFREKLTRWNDNLEKWAIEDKEIYKSLAGVSGSSKVIEELAKAGLVRLSKERLRLEKAPLREKKGKEMLAPAERIAQALSRTKGYKIILKKGKISAKEPPIKVIHEDNTVLIYEEHPDLAEIIEMDGVKFTVRYDEWSQDSTPYSVCKLSDDHNTVIFNKSHPLFRSRLSNEIIKRLCLGMVMIVKDRKDDGELLRRINRLLERIFSG